MKKQEKPIQEYTELICSLLIDQFNVKYEHYSECDFKKEANERYVERDWVYKIGEHFNELAYYEVQDSEKTSSHHDICVPSKDFIIEVKYLRNWNSTSKTRSVSKNFYAYEKDLQWLEKEILSGRKNKSAFILIWFNCIDYFGQVMQLGTSHGVRNPVNLERLVYFPFLMSCNPNNSTILTKDLSYNYERAFPCQLDLNIIGKGNVNMNCLFLGNASDRLHIAIYY